MTKRSTGLRVRLLLTLLGAAMLVGGALLVALLVFVVIATAK